MTATLAQPVAPPAPTRGTSRGPRASPYRNAAEWWDSIGRVPLERVVFDPLPGTATPDDVTRLDDHEDRLCELIDGTLVEKAMGYTESMIAMRVGHFLTGFVHPRRLGYVSGEAGLMRILADRIRIPDVAFVSRDRLPNGPPPEPIPNLFPDLAVEVLSESNTRREMEIKMQEYFRSGARLVWYLDPPTRTVDVFTSPRNPTRLGEADTLTGGDVLPGFEVRVADLFDVG